MSQEVTQWISEIKSLQQKLAEAHRERDEAYVSAASWRSLYETEAKQRRLEAHLSRQAIEALKEELQMLQEPLEATSDRAAIQSEVAALSNLEDLRVRLVEALQESDRLMQALRAEQSAHTETRESLTTALGDAIDQLNEERSVRQKAPSPTANNVIAMSDFTAQPPKTPSLELPPTD
ncbi:MAG: hypothetical protein HY785_00915 [Oscillatoriophycideae cyanobacterium NC_groundwater_1537_Pr4_S-0.65um_50_18]|nr:hypothetical protein [Oscillatoriophycideae cyanobacterium NC_groundwater_1537_Pr4_S-0.65um_50_18]